MYVISNFPLVTVYSLLSLSLLSSNIILILFFNLETIITIITITNNYYKSLFLIPFQDVKEVFAITKSKFN